MLASWYLVPVVAASAAAELTVAIYGGGVASATLAQALKNYDHINVEYFDPNFNLTPTSFRLLGLSPKTWDALELVGPDAGGAINRAGWYPEDPSIIIMGQGPDAGKVVLDYDTLPNTTGVPEVAVVDPAPFLMEMLHGTPEEKLHPNMTLVDISPQSDEGPIDLTFSDGTKLTADVLIGDDGPVGLMRSYVLGADNDATYPRFMNILSAVGHVPPKDAHKLLGDPFGDRAAERRFERVGDGAFLLSAYLDGFFTTLGSFYSDEDYDLSQFTRPTTPEELESHFGNFKGGNGIVEALSRFSGLRLIPEIEHPHAETFVKGPVAMAGTAAHLMTNFQQLGPGQELEDAMIMGAVLGAAIDRRGVIAALQAYDEVRRPRAFEEQHHGKMLGALWTGTAEGVGLDMDKLKEAFLQLRETAESFDMVEHRRQALSLMARKLQEGDQEQKPSTAFSNRLQQIVGLTGMSSKFNWHDML